MNISADLAVIYQQTINFIERNNMEYVIQISGYCFSALLIAFSVWAVVSLGLNLYRNFKRL